MKKKKDKRVFVESIFKKRNSFDKNCRKLRKNGNYNGFFRANSRNVGFNARFYIRPTATAISAGALLRRISTF